LLKALLLVRVLKDDKFLELIEYHQQALGTKVAAGALEHRPDAAGFRRGFLPDHPRPQQLLFEDGDGVLISTQANDDRVLALQPGKDPRGQQRTFARAGESGEVQDRTGALLEPAQDLLMLAVGAFEGGFVLARRKLEIACPQMAGNLGEPLPSPAVNQFGNGLEDQCDHERSSEKG